VNTEYILLDNTAPSGNLLSPENKTYQETSTVNLNVTRSDATSGVDLEEYSLDGGGFSSFTANDTVSGLSEGQHSINYRVSDKAGNTFATGERYFYINITQKYYVANAPAGKAVAPAGSPSSDLTDWSNAVAEGASKVLFGNSLGSDYAAELEINLTKNVSTQHLVVDSNRTTREAVVHNTSSVENVYGKSLLVPRVNGSGVVRICPGAENLSAVDGDCSNGYNISSGETVNGVTLSEVTINSVDYYEATGVSGTGGFEFAVASGSGGSGGSGGDGGSTTSTSVTFSNPTVSVAPGGTKLVDVRVNNSGVEGENTVTVDVPDTDSCSAIQIRESNTGSGYGKSGEYTVPAGQVETVSNMMRLELPSDFEGTGFACSLDVSASESGTGDFVVSVERSTGWFAWWDNVITTWPFYTDLSAVGEQEPQGELEITQGRVVTGLSLIGLLAVGYVVTRN
jgi:hypothetical protein